MSNTRKAHISTKEQLRLITECRQNGMTDTDWCRENGIAVSTFYNRVSRCRKVAAYRIPVPTMVIWRSHSQNHMQSLLTLSQITVQNSHTAPLTRQTSPDSSHTIEVTMRDVCIRIRSDADLPLLSRALHLIRKILCQETSPGLESFTSSAVIQICTNLSIAAVPSSETSSTVIFVSLIFLFYVCTNTMTV